MTDSSASPHGFVEAGYESVAEAFDRAIADDTGTGAALSIWRDGRLVIDLAGGVADRATGRAFSLDTPSVIFSSTKGLASILLAHLVQEGRLDYDALVTDYWPEYAAEGKGDTRVSAAISHRAGLSAPRRDWAFDDILDWQRATALLAEQQPLFEPGTAWAYHAITHGWLTGELVHRVTGMLPGAYFEHCVTQPLGVEAWIGLPVGRHDRVARMIVGDSLAALVAQQQAELDAGGAVWSARAMTLGGALPLSLVGPDLGFNRADVQEAQIPGAGGVSTAHALAKIWSAVVVETDGVRLLNDTTIARATRVQSQGAPFFDVPGPWPRWAMGFQLDSEARRYLGDTSLGHDGAGGQVAFGDVESRIGFAFLTNRMEAVDRRGTDIIEALRRSIA
ncbi:serine hydrolase domain-containing protein [Subtercola vilae]|uniref:Class A beta-lactamase-related serine hydrolase n=1 Tax=Subtercola vilae TaxID=2056433 RepID=A0A4T2BT60_9MICO|nr:serine hydrolase domain-containing protein [Subtercola vilae]TIH34845.1 class A beta-lactamase-related serine hydrolase [Subtercola vilae]